MQRLGFNVTDDMSEALRELNEETQVPISVMLRQALEEYLEKKGRVVEGKIRWGGNRRDQQPKSA